MTVVLLLFVLVITLAASLMMVKTCFEAKTLGESWISAVVFGLNLALAVYWSMELAAYL